MAFDTILVANRGEIAARVIRTAQELGLRTVAVYTNADAHAPHVQMADEAVLIGEGPVSESYLNPDRILDVARDTGAGAIHPGYGFLSENAEFAEAVQAAGMVFIGPTADAIRIMGNKAEAKRLMISVGVPCVPGYEGADQSDAALGQAAAEIGFPIMVKAAAGGGGRGMRLVFTAAELPNALALARSEAENAFGSGELILEKAIIEPRHVEFQIFADCHGYTVHLGERDCSVQRRHQKVVEEAPCPVMAEDLRARMGAAAVNAAQAVNYHGAGTVEFLLDASGDYYFLEMNTRLQVEHPVTEMVTGQDLVALQIMVAQGAPLPISQDEVRIEGHAIEVRLYAEDPSNSYLPATGRVDLWHPARGQGVRVDAGICEGQEVSPFYDPMLAKIIAHGSTREAARSRLVKAVKNTVLLGMTTNTAFLADVLEQPEFAAAEATTGLLERSYPDGFPHEAPAREHVALALAILMQDERERALSRAGFVSQDQLNWSSARVLPRRVNLVTGETEFAAAVSATCSGWLVQIGEDMFDIWLTGEMPHLTARINGARHRAVAQVSGDEVKFAIGAERLAVRRLRAGVQEDSSENSGNVTAPMPGLVLEMKVEPGDSVASGDVLAVLEAMKMQHQIVATVSGVVRAAHVTVGQQLAAGDMMIEIEEG
ncbi:acetyl/propionyl/methylcrotonyl-CoA carboxylase subunit alpha [Primorskyibacter sp. S87]|uniref:acetyl/propionyl/methylcrotonyl-CoA carboxylase subunit alpha n=1 Tax=Primorskyibacter sp. S87 TaxID=3415126 RepID=UPI003C7CF013